LTSSEMIERRIEALRGRMNAAGVDTALVIVREGFNWESCFYLSGFRGSSGALVISADDAFLVTDGRYLSQAAEQTHLRIVDQGPTPIMDLLCELVPKTTGAATLGFQADRVTCDLLGSLKKIGGDLVDISTIFSALRRSKDRSEVDCISKAAEAAADALSFTLERSEKGFTEKGFEADLHHAIRTGKAEGGWGGQDFIVASGPRSALPHGIPTGREAEAGEIVMVDFGTRFNGYICDITRVLSLGEIPSWAAEAHDLLVEAQAAAIPLLEPGRPAMEADRAARSVLEKAGLADSFTHSLGHGIGLEVHESPSVSSRSRDIFAPGDVVTVEPGVYFPGKGGVRLEDDYFISGEGPVCLTPQLPKKILEPGFRALK